MSSLPRLFMPMPTESGGLHAQHAVDVTLVVAEKLSQVFFFSIKHAAMHIANLPIERLIPLRLLSPYARQNGWGADTEEVARRVEAWVDGIGGRESLPSVVAHLRALEVSRGVIKEAQEAFAALKDAHLLPMVDTGVYYAPCQANKLIRTRGEISPPQLPFVFWTKEPSIWEGISPAYIRRCHRKVLNLGRPEYEGAHLDYLMAELDAVIRADMEQHNEGAEDAIEDMGALYAAVESWFPSAGKGDLKDRELEEFVENWNKRQKIISYYPDFSKVSPLDAGEGLPVLLHKSEQFIRFLQDDLQEAMACYAPQNESRLMPIGAP